MGASTALGSAPNSGGGLIDASDQAGGTGHGHPGAAAAPSVADTKKPATPGAAGLKGQLEVRSDLDFVGVAGIAVGVRGFHPVLRVVLRIGVAEAVQGIEFFW